MSDIKGFFPDATLFNNLIEGYQPYVKVTGRMGAHEIEGVFQRDRTNGESSWEYFAEPLNVYGNGGNLYMGKITSVWGQRLTSTFLAGYNDKGGSRPTPTSGRGSRAPGRRSTCTRARRSAADVCAATT